MPEYIDAANAAARSRGLDATFRVLNAFDLAELEDGAFDLAVIIQTMHHFTAASSRC